MKTIYSLPYLLVFIPLLFSSCIDPETIDWSAQKAPIMTRWSADVEVNQPWDLYPRPALKRSDWTNLNGLWDYAITRDQRQAPDSMDGKILVPYPVESALSGVMKRVSAADYIWYRKTLKVPDFNEKQRLLMHFEASDWLTILRIDGEKVGEHRGGYTPFSFDISDWVDSRKQVLIEVVVWDPTTEGTQAVGKQNSSPHGIWYTPSSGIWQTVWMEVVPETYIIDYQAKADIDQHSVTLSAEVLNSQPGDQVRYEVILNGERISEALAPSDQAVEMNIPDMVLWEPDQPTLYDVKLSIIRGDEVIDQADGYFGMRKISIGKDKDGFTRILLNNKFVFQNGPLDQGFWPDGLYTPPTEEAMVYDLEQLKEMGFNMLRKHVKVENRRFYYHTDQMGMLVWQDMPNANWGHPTEDIKTGKGHTLQFEQELQDLVLTLDNHPSIIMWVPFNEGWGQYDTERIVKMVERLDPTRLINNASGWSDHGVGHVHDIHNYPNPVAPPAEEKRAIVLGEFGGLGLPVPGHTWQQDKNWGYENMAGAESLLEKYEAFYHEVHRLVKEKGLSAVVYTQTTDVEIETNGLLSYDREVDKMGVENIRKAHFGYCPPRLTNEITQFIDEYQIVLQCSKPGTLIYFTTDGTDPDLNSQLYSSPVTIQEATDLKAFAFWKDGEKSRITHFRLNKTTPLPALSHKGLTGLNYQLYRGAWEKIPDFAALTPAETGKARQINLDPAKNLTADFGLVFTGFLKVPETDVYLITVSSDDGGRLFIDGKMLIDYDGIHGMGEKKNTIALKKGLHSIEFHYFQHLGGLGLKLLWESNQLAKTEIGTQFYYR